MQRIAAGIMIVVILAIVALVIVVPRLPSFTFARAVLPYPREWEAVALGDSPETVTSKCPDRHDDHFKNKGSCLYRAPHFYGYWTMHLEFDDDDRLRSKSFSLRFGTRWAYHDYRYQSSSKADR